MVDVPNNQSFVPGASGSIVTKRLGIFRKYMDSVILGGNTITLDLPAAVEDCPDPNCRFNPTYQRYQGANGALCYTCRGDGKIKTLRQTTYNCNRRAINEDLAKSLTGNQNTEGGRIRTNVFRVKTHISSYSDILKCVGATIDGQKVKLVQSPRKTGWDGELLYVISFWEEANKLSGQS